MATSKQNSNIASFVNSFIADLDERQREVIKLRYGLGGKEAQTLQAIGNKYSITRERVRQIESMALGALRKKLDDAYAKNFIQTAVNRLKLAGNVEKENLFFAELKKELGDTSADEPFTNSARFILELSGKLGTHRYNHDLDWHPHWHITTDDKKRAHGFISKLISALDSEKEEVLSKDKFDEVFKAVAKASNISESVARNFISISKNFGTNAFDKFGLMKWPEINPKTARDWAYLILKRENKPLHFTDLAKTIAKFRKEKRVNVQTVHNELIKDNRFVLVGRGLYGLREQGLIPGTALEIIKHTLTENGPMHTHEVVATVKKQRLIKEGTILINLQNKKHFKSLPDGRFTLC
ncbi:MAG: hypothetical protein COU07_00215 [Candidatus Harrisonbacteria bacterium CG10_big_fil_rev_8_21_14_0_10_40_38]|uniref:HTH HARE-type domain-containing protein n=1 Tax=Candidatus Harrisonbacteria bacterium CG10_big_fil_rev_8_21_14_0_10_40_38 TaxID=1974583 RepID=A0A2H0USE9_9BACT|nr:MAG: hypothetical protein COU07_00215 [Candidatus Harrisonbacteria bacterium CG10_big_fil_rev_8_21_14_0_10_40_38]